MKKTKLWNHNFKLIVIGQIISLFGNNILRFALSMVVLDKTGSVSSFASILALSMVPTILLSSFGGILADRVNKRNIMVGLDFLTALVIFIFSMVVLNSNIVLVIGVMMVILSIIQAFYLPAVQASIPIVVDEDYLLQANGIVVQVNALASLAGPIIGGFLYGFYGIMPIIVISGFCFLFSAIMELFIHMKSIKLKKKNSFFQLILTDFKEAFHFLIKEQTAVFYLLILIACLNVFLSALLIVGLPFFIKMFLNFNNQWYGFIEAAMGVGSILGGISVGMLIKKVDFKHSYYFLFLASLLLFPIAISLITSHYSYLSYFVILISVIFLMGSATVFTIYGQTIIQKLTPQHMLGKVASVVSVISMCALPIGQILYGSLFEFFKTKSFVIVIISGLICLVIAFFSKKVLFTVKD